MMLGGRSAPHRSLRSVTRFRAQSAHDTASGGKNVGGGKRKWGADGNARVNVAANRGVENIGLADRQGSARRSNLEGLAASHSAGPPGSICRLPRALARPRHSRSPCPRPETRPPGHDAAPAILRLPPAWTAPSVLQEAGPLHPPSPCCPLPLPQSRPSRCGQCEPAPPTPRTQLPWNDASHFARLLSRPLRLRASGGIFGSRAVGESWREWPAGDLCLVSLKTQCHPINPLTWGPQASVWPVWARIALSVFLPSRSEAKTLTVAAATTS